MVRGYPLKIVSTQRLNLLCHPLLLANSLKFNTTIPNVVQKCVGFPGNERLTTTFVKL